jgi:hypothetical protein
MNDSLITNIVPITYFGGTGGHFLRSLLIAAKVGYEPTWEFSPYGHAHWAPAEQYNDSFIDLSGSKIPHTLGLTVEQILDKINKSKIYCDPLQFYYHQFHLVDLNSLMRHFSRSIRICYEFKDAREIALAMLAKSGIDAKHVKDPSNVKELRDYFMKRQIMGIKYYKDFQRVNNIHKVYSVGWDMLLRNDPEMLFEGLYSFTGLENFSLDNLMCWRELTLKGISDMEQRIK